MQLINIANEYYSERGRMRLMYSQMLSDAGKDAEEHRQAVSELNNRMEYFDQLMVERCVCLYVCACVFVGMYCMYVHVCVYVCIHVRT